MPEQSHLGLKILVILIASALHISGFALESAPHQPVPELYAHNPFIEESQYEGPIIIEEDEIYRPQLQARRFGTLERNEQIGAGPLENVYAQRRADWGTNRGPYRSHNEAINNARSGLWDRLHNVMARERDELEYLERELDRTRQDSTWQRPGPQYSPEMHEEQEQARIRDTDGHLMLIEKNEQRNERGAWEGTDTAQVQGQSGYSINRPIPIENQEVHEKHENVLEEMHSRSTQKDNSQGKSQNEHNIANESPEKRADNGGQAYNSSPSKKLSQNVKDIGFKI